MYVTLHTLYIFKYINAKFKLYVIRFSKFRIAYKEPFSNFPNFLDCIFFQRFLLSLIYIENKSNVIITKTVTIRLNIVARNLNNEEAHIELAW